MVVFNRTKNRFQFAPVLECKAVQEIQIVYDLQEECDYARSVYVDGDELYEKEIEKLALNDGFDSIPHFFQWFNDDFKGKIIHWTELKY